MRRLLYITPYFAPQTRVGALRPLKFVRHLPALGWDPIVLADLRGDDATSADLWDAVPAELSVHFDYSHVARLNFERFIARRDAAAGAPPVVPAVAPAALAPRAQRDSVLRHIPSFRWSPEYVPLGEHAVDIPWAYRAGARLLAKHPDIEAIVVNADPHAALIVGTLLHRRSGVPLVLDFRDPWSVCDVRRRERPAPQRAFVDRVERWCIAHASATILNSDTALEAYREHYGPAFDNRFSVIRNHSEPALVNHGTASPGQTFTMAYIGTFRRYLDGDVMLRALGHLRSGGLADDALRLLVTGRLGADARALATSLGVAAWIDERPPVPYTAIGPLMDSADLLVAQTTESRQRIPAKFYDYALSSRPMLIVADARHDELRQLTTQQAAGRFVDMRDIGAVADAIAAELAMGRRRVRAHAAESLRSHVASQALASLLDRVGAAAAQERP